MSERLNEIRAASFLSPEMGSEVVRELVTEIDFLREELHQRDKYIDEQVGKLDSVIQRHTFRSDRWAALVNEKNQLIGVRDEGWRIHKALRGGKVVIHE